MHPLELWGLNGYYICVLWNSNNQEFWMINGFSKKQPLCSISTLIHIKKSIEPQITAKNGILLSCLVVGTSFFQLL